MKHFSRFFSGNYIAPENSDLKTHLKSNEELDNEIQKIGTFVRCGLVVLSLVLISGIGISYSRNKLTGNISTLNSNRITAKELPIYCVEQNKPKIALSFDAAWGASFLLNNFSSL